MSINHSPHRRMLLSSQQVKQPESGTGRTNRAVGSVTGLLPAFSADSGRVIEQQ
jgi:hypothetical protein